MEKEFPKIYFISDGKDGKDIIEHLKSIGGKNRFYGMNEKKAYRWIGSDFRNGDFGYIDENGNISCSVYMPANYKLKNLRLQKRKIKSIK